MPSTQKLTTGGVSRRRKCPIKSPRSIHILPILRRLILIHAPNIIPANLLLLGGPEAAESHQSLHLRLLVIHDSLHLVGIPTGRCRCRGSSTSICTGTPLSTTL